MYRGQESPPVFHPRNTPEGRRFNNGGTTNFIRPVGSPRTVNFQQNNLAPANISSNVVMEFNQLEKVKELPQVSNIEKTRAGGADRESGSEVVLMVTKVSVSNPEFPNKIVEGYALLDPGSQKSFITKEIAKNLKLSEFPEREIQISTFAQKSTTNLPGTDVRIAMKLVNNESIVLNALAVQSLTATLEHVKINKNDGNNNIKIESSDKVKPDILIGADYFFDLVQSSTIQKLENGLYLIRTSLGDVIAGKRILNYHNKHEQPKALNTKLHCLNNYSNQDLKVLENGDTKNCEPTPSPEKIESLWSLEGIGIIDSATERDDEKAIKYFEETVKYDEGRYCVKFPWKNGTKNQLSNNYGLCVGRLKSILKKVQENEYLREQYSNVIEEQLNKGIIEPCSKSNGLDYYIPHQPVVTPTKATTKVRIVFDASAKINKRKLSLNETMYRGPVLIPNLVGVLMRIRLYRNLLVADIEKAFLQVGLNSDDRDFTRFLWVKNPMGSLDKSNLIEYRFARIPFGVIASPFLLGAVLKHHLNVLNEEEKATRQDNHKLRVIEQCMENLYVDNIFIEVNDVADAKLSFDFLLCSFKQASMNLREFQSNLSEVKQCFPSDKIVSESKSKLLGLTWDTINDEMHIELVKRELLQNERWTKRKILSCIGKNYDPLGYICPALLKARIIFQNLWMRKCDWDSQIPDDLEKEWQKVSADWISNSCIAVPRNISVSTPDSEKELHVFTDASKLSYAAVAYLRQKTDDSITSNIWFAKCRLSPVKEKINIPRLELLGMLIGCRLVQFVRKSVNLAFKRVILWSDSEVAISWVSTRKVLPRFVENRVREINAVKDLEIRHVAGKENPADLATRGTTVTELKSKKCWWHGPHWLVLQESEWPAIGSVPSQKLEETQTSLEEEFQIVINNINTNSYTIPYKNFSSVINLKRSVAYILRFIRKLVKKSSTGDQSIQRLVTAKIPVDKLSEKALLRAEDVKAAEKLLIRIVQGEGCGEIITALHCRNKNNKLIHQLGIKEKESILICCGRYQKLAMPYSTKYPILIPNSHPFTTLVIKEAHEMCGHFGLSSTLAKIREKFWIIKGRTTVKSVLKKCLVCIRYQGKPYVLPKMAPLPTVRGNMEGPFQHIGLDYFGPLLIRNDKKVEKTWVCLIACLVVRAIHMEIVEDLSTKSFLGAFKRFIARRGTPRSIISDNAKTFISAERTWRLTWSRNMDSEEINNYFTNKQITWKFITPYAPWKGGVYERLIGIVKSALRKSLGRRILTKDDFHTLVVEVESIVNARPLTYVYDEIDANLVRPIDLLMPYSRSEFSYGAEAESNDEDYEVKADHLVNQYKSSLQVINRFWNTWYHEYLKSLREKQNMKHRQPKNSSAITPQVGDVVLIKDNGKSRGCWPFGKVVSISKNTVGDITEATVKTKSGSELSRPINLLYPLELSNSASNRGKITDVRKMYERTRHPADPNLEMEKEEDEL